jgi:hypothetical protein
VLQGAKKLKRIFFDKLNLLDNPLNFTSGWGGPWADSGINRPHATGAGIGIRVRAFDGGPRTWRIMPLSCELGHNRPRRFFPKERISAGEGCRCFSPPRVVYQPIAFLKE